MSETGEPNATPEADEVVNDTPMTVEERLLYLEEQNEGLKRVGKLLLGLCLLVGVLLVWTQAGLRSSVYTESVIFGTASAPRGTLTSTPNGHLAFLFYDHLGILPPDPKFNLIPSLDGFAIYDRDGKPRIVIGIDDQNKSIFDVYDENGKLIFSAVPRVLPDGSRIEADGKKMASPTDATSPTPTAIP